MLFGAMLGCFGVQVGGLGGPSWRFGWLFGVFEGAFGVLWGSLGDPLGVPGALGASLGVRVASWALRKRFPGFSGKFREPVWLHFGAMFC